MKEASAIITALYENFLLRDLFAKIVPGVVVILVSLYQSPFADGLLSVAEDIGWPVIFIGAGIAWIVGFAIQEIGQFTGIIKHQIKEYSDAKERYALRTKFKAVASSGDSQQVERYAIIKEATGNGATATLISFVILYVHKINVGDPLFSWPSATQEATMLILALALLFANRGHAERQYRYMESVIETPS